MIWCDRNLIQSPLYVALCLSEKKYLKEVKRMGIKNPPPWIKTAHADATANFFTRDGKESVIVCLRNHENHTGVEVAALLVHEAVHIWQAVRDIIGETSPSSEFEAYSVQQISLELMWAYEEMTAKK